MSLAIHAFSAINRLFWYTNLSHHSCVQIAKCHHMHDPAAPLTQHAKHRLHVLPTKSPSTNLGTRPAPPLAASCRCGAVGVSAQHTSPTPLLALMRTSPHPVHCCPLGRSGHTSVPRLRMCTEAGKVIYMFSGTLLASWETEAQFLLRVLRWGVGAAGRRLGKHREGAGVKKSAKQRWQSQDTEKERAPGRLWRGLGGVWSSLRPGSPHLTTRVLSC